MLQRKNGRILLALLVVTGMAGTPKTSGLSAEERKICIVQLKKSKNDLTIPLRTLSTGQLQFRSPEHQLSIQESIYHIATVEEALEKQLRLAMRQPVSGSGPARASYNDTELINMMTVSGHSSFPKVVLSRTWQSTQQALNAFRITRSNQVKYIRNTTENLRDRVVELAIGYVDCYQLMLIMSNHTRYHIDHILEIMEHADFPRL